MNIKVDFDNIVVKEDKNDFNVKVLMLKGEKGDQGDGEANVIEVVKVNGTALPVNNKAVNVSVPVIDNAISSSSTNPVQNKVIYSALSNKVNNSTLDNYYEVSEVDAMINNKADVSTVEKKPYYFDNVAEMKVYDLQEGDYVITKGYYSANDGGCGEYVIVDDNTLVDNGGSIHTLDNGLKAELISDNEINIKQFGAYGDNVHDDSEAIQYSINNFDKIFIPCGTYRIVSSITIDKNTKIIGQDMNDTVINFNDDSDFLFKYITTIGENAYDIKTNILLDNFKVNCKNFIKFNEHNLDNTDWKKQGSLLHIELKNLNLIGKYGDINDTNKNTNVLPALSELLGYGCAIEGNSIFDSEISNCRITSFGLGIYFKGCDINKIGYNRITNNGCHIFLERCDTYGSQNRIIHNDILHNLRYGGIRIYYTRFDTIEDNYFECLTASACAIYGENDGGLSIINNRFDNPNQSDIDLIRLSPGLTANISFNRINPSTNDKHCYINVLTDHIGNFNNQWSYNTALIFGNNGKLEQRNNPLTTNGTYNPLLISPYNINIDTQRETGTRFVQPYFILDTTENLYYYLDTTASGSSLILQFEKLKKYYGKYPKIRFKYKSSETTMYVQVKGDGNTLYGNNVSLTNDSTIHYVDLDLTSNTNFYDVLRIELPVKSGVKLFSVELI